MEFSFGKHISLFVVLTGLVFQSIFSFPVTHEMLLEAENTDTVKLQW